PIHTTPHLFSHSYSDPLVLHSFPTRRSSDLRIAAREHARQQRSIAREPGQVDGLAARAPCGPFGERAISVNDQCHRALCSQPLQDRKSTRLNSSHLVISYAVFCLKKKK